MIYSERFNYLFLENPNTGSTAISLELQTYYGGHEVSKRHAFLGMAVKELGEDRVKRAFKFCTVRNPLDAWVSRYEKLRHNHNNNYTDPKRRRENGDWVPAEQIEMYEFVASGASFPEFVRKYPDSIKTKWIYRTRQCDFVLRFENLQEDFNCCLEKIGQASVRPLPQINKTEGKKHFLTYYDETALDVARERLGRVMEELGYPLPECMGPRMS